MSKGQELEDLSAFSLDMLIYCSIAGETVIIVFLNVVVHQKPLFRIETLAKKYFLQAVYML